MNPHKSYIIWFTPRTGSTFLCNLLEQTGIAGHPGEFFNKDDHMSLQEQYGLSSYEELRHHLWSLGCSSNGVMGMKYSLYDSSYESISSELARLQGLTPTHYYDRQILSDLFPGCKHIYLTRRNKIQLVVSWWKAIQDNQWHLREDEQKLHTEDFYRDKYNADALLHLLKDHNLRECIIQQYFDYNRIVPYTIVYEDLIKDVEKKMLNILDFLKLDISHVPVFKSDFHKTSDQITEIWVDRFRADIQEGWDKVIW